MNAESIMHKDFVVVSPEESMLDVGKKLYEKNQHGAIVNDSKTGEIVGVVTEGDVIGFDNMPYDSKIVDFLDKLASIVLPTEKDVNMRDVHQPLSSEELSSDLEVKVSEYMNERLITVQPTTLVEEICKILKIKRVHFIPVVKNKKAVGVIYERDLLKHILDEVKQ
ncbi:MAG: CBS domain-containing protein [Nitrospinae bacterium]|nr:CBS domain-containing protein [Nitrospinota bacterium]